MTFRIFLIVLGTIASAAHSFANDKRALIWGGGCNSFNPFKERMISELETLRDEGWKTTLGFSSGEELKKLKKEVKEAKEGGRETMMDFLDNVINDINHGKTTPQTQILLSVHAHGSKTQENLAHSWAYDVGSDCGGISIDDGELNEKLKLIGSKVKLLIVDQSCYSGPSAERFRDYGCVITSQDAYREAEGSPFSRALEEKTSPWFHGAVSAIDTYRSCLSYSGTKSEASKINYCQISGFKFDQSRLGEIKFDNPPSITYCAECKKTSIEFGQVGRLIQDIDQVFPNSSKLSKENIRTVYKKLNELLNRHSNTVRLYQEEVARLYENEGATIPKTYEIDLNSIEIAKSLNLPEQLTSKELFGDTKKREVPEYRLERGKLTLPFSFDGPQSRRFSNSFHDLLGFYPREFAYKIIDLDHQQYNKIIENSLSPEQKRRLGLLKKAWLDTHDEITKISDQINEMYGQLDRNLVDLQQEHFEEKLKGLKSANDPDAKALKRCADFIF